MNSSDFHSKNMCNIRGKKSAPVAVICILAFVNQSASTRKF